MGVYIRGMEMPTSCINCRFSGFGGLRNERVVCMHTGSNAYMNEVEFLDDCPLVSVPKHGRLIDADALILPVNLNDWNSVSEYVQNITDVWNAIDNAPTIIEGDEE